MFTNIRHNCFESNSSSSHSVNIKEGDIYDKTFDPVSIRAGVIRLYKRTAGYDCFYRFYKPENILPFLICSQVEFEINVYEILDKFPPAVRYEDVDILPLLRNLSDTIDTAFRLLEHEFGLKFEFIVTPADNFDFDTCNLSYVTEPFKDFDALKKLLTGRDSYIETEEENCWTDGPINTDRGVEIIPPRRRVEIDLLELFQTERVKDMLGEREKDVPFNAHPDP